MRKSSTQKMYKCFNKKEEKVVAPSEKTINLLKQFARSCYVEKTLPKSLNELCMN